MTITSSRLMNSSQSLGSTYCPDCSDTSMEPTSIVTISSLIFTFILLKLSCVEVEYFTSKSLISSHPLIASITISIQSYLPVIVPFIPSVARSIVPNMFCSSHINCREDLFNPRSLMVVK